MLNAKQMQAKSAAVKRSKADRRRQRVAELYGKMTVAQMCQTIEIDGKKYKPRTIYKDIAFLKKEGTLPN